MTTAPSSYASPKHFSFSKTPPAYTSRTPGRSIGIGKHQQPLIDKLRSRKCMRETIVPGGLAMTITKNYILPILDKRSSKIPKLSQLLSKQITQISALYEETLDKYEQTTQETDEMDSEIAWYKRQIEIANNTKHSLLQQIKEKQVCFEGIKAESQDAACKLSKIREEYNEIYILDENLYLRFINNQIQHSDLIFQSQIMGERLLALHETHKHLFGREYLEEPIEREASSIKTTSPETYFSDLLESTETVGLKMLKHSQAIVSHANTSLVYIENIHISHQKLTEKLDSLRADLNFTNNQIATFKDRQNKVELNIAEMTNEHDRMVQVCRVFKETHPSIFKQSESICKNCNGMFKESENYNWSCVWHAAYWEDGIYWCCGKTSKDARGCQFTKHVSKEEGEEEELKSNDKSEFCISCRRNGHSHPHCPRDPNVKTKAESFSELQRLKKIRKIKTGVLSETMKTKLFEGLRNKETVRAFVKPHHLEFRKEVARISFNDVRRIRNHVAFSPDNNRVKICFEESADILPEKKNSTPNKMSFYTSEPVIRRQSKLFFYKPN